MKTHPVGVQFRADGTKLVISFRNSVKAPKERTQNLLKHSF